MMMMMMMMKMKNKKNMNINNKNNNMKKKKDNDTKGLMRPEEGREEEIKSNNSLGVRSDNFRKNL